MFRRDPEGLSRHAQARVLLRSVAITLERYRHGAGPRAAQVASASPPHRVHRSFTPGPHDGWGVVEPEGGSGLAIAKSLVEAHGGAIGAESAPGRGTTIRFTLPAC